MIRIAKKTGYLAFVMVATSATTYWSVVTVCHYSGGGLWWFIGTLLTCSY